MQVLVIKESLSTTSTNHSIIDDIDLKHDEDQQRIWSSQEIQGSDLYSSLRLSKIGLKKLLRTWCSKYWNLYFSLKVLVKCHFNWPSEEVHMYLTNEAKGNDDYSQCTHIPDIRS